MSIINTRKTLFNSNWLILYLILMFIVAGAGWFTMGFLGDRARHEILEYNESTISLHFSHLTAEFEKIEKAVKSLSGSPWITPALISRKDRDIANANSVLDRYNSSMGSSVSYLLDSNGITIASSNRNDSDSFVGKSYHFRPYFTQAIKGAPGRYFALGATSLKRGFYSSYPVRDDKGVIIGVAVIKEDVDAEEAHFVKTPYCFVVDPNGIIFLSGKKEMTLKSLWPVSRETQLALLKSKQFGTKEFEAVLPREVADGTEITFEGKKYLASRKVVNPEGWSIVLMTTTERIFIYKSVGMIITIFICAFITVPFVINYRISASAEMIRESESLLRNIIDSSKDYIYVKDLRLRTILCNTTFAAAQGKRPKDLIGKMDIENGWDPEYIKGNPEKGIRGIENDDLSVIRGETVHIQYEPGNVKGETHFFNTIKIPLRNQNSKITGVLGISRDITERKKMEEKKAELDAKAWQIRKAESLNRMAGAIAHNFNNQLGAVIGNLELAIINLSGNTGPVEILKEAMKSACKAADMSGLMLTYLGHTDGKHEPLDLSLICLRNLRILRAGIPKELELKTDLPSPGPTVKANEKQMLQALTNLITNSWEAMGDGRGIINLTVKTVSSADIPIAHRFPIDWKPQENAYACLEVADAGCGIVDNDIEKLFDPFYSSKFTGRGLGLAVVLGILRAHRGAVTVESEPGKGSIFRVFLPVSAEEVSQKPEEAAEAPKQEEGGTILLVEDEPSMRKMAMTMLTFMGYAVLEAADGAEAVDMFQQHKDEIRCVLCDLTMPRMDGWETLAALRKLSPDIPFILASGYDKAKVMSGYHAEWPQAFLGKPYMLNELSDAIRLAMAKRSGELVARGLERRKL